MSCLDFSLKLVFCREERTTQGTMLDLQCHELEINPCSRAASNPTYDGTGTRSLEPPFPLSLTKTHQVLLFVVLR